MGKKDENFNLFDGIISVLESAMETEMYFNPHVLKGILDTLDEFYFADRDIPEEILKWAEDMWSR